ncbi:MAG: metallophosphoesterase, partial [Jatrophihabitans sp.]|nr:metallophosphoesterase [Jatrophihabitans sp.]
MLGIVRLERRARWAGSVGSLVVLVLVLAFTSTPVGAQVPAAWNVALTRAPYLTDLVASHVNVNWATDRSGSQATLKWGPVTGGSCSLANTATPTRLSVTVGSVAEYQWTSGLTLPAQGTYCYRPFLGGIDLLGADTAPQFRSQVPAGDPASYSFDVFGDWGQVDSTGNSVDQKNLFAQVAASGARFAVTVGDNGYTSGSQINYGDLHQTGAGTSAIFGPSFWTAAGSTIPIFTTAGNHGLSGTTHTDITTWTQDQAVAASGGRYQNDTYCCVNGSASANYGSEWYAFDAGPARFYVLDSAWGDTNGGTASPYANDAAAHFRPGTPEYDWLLHDLQTHPSALKFAFSHYPMYADNPNQSSDTFLQGPQGLEGLLGQYGVNIEFNGHTHVYERNRSSGPGMPITYVTGGGGATLQPIGPCHAYDAYGIGWSPTKLVGTACGAASAPTSAASVFHFLKVTVSGTTVTVAPTDENGNTFDVQTYSFSAVPDTVIDSAPAGFVNSHSASFAFRSTRPGATFACSLDGAPATACTSPATYASVGDGPHSFSVVATTSTGTDPTPAVAQWTVDTSPPTTPTQLTGSPTAVAVNLSWTASSDPNGLAGYDIQRDGVKIGTAAASATTYTDTSVAPSTTYRYTVLARDTAGNPSVASDPATVTTPTGSAGPALVQSAGSSTTTVVLSGPSAGGDLLVLTAGVYTGATKVITAVTDDAGNQWLRAGAYAVAGQNSDGELWYAANAAPATRVTVTTGAVVALQVQEFNGVAASNPLDGSIGAAGTSQAAASGASTPTSTNDLAIGFVAGHGNAQAMSVTSPGYTAGAQQTTTSPSIVSVRAGWRALGSAAAQTFSASFASTMYWSAGVALFKAAVGGPPPPPDDFSMSASPSSLTITAGQSATSSIGVATTSGNPQAVALSASGAPAGVSVSFSPSSVTSGNASTMTVATTASATSGSYTIVVTGAGSATHSTSVGLTVTAASSATPSLVQSAAGTETAASTTLAASLPSATKAGDLLVLSASLYTGATNHLTSITDSAGNSWVKVNAWSTASHNSDGEMWYAANVAATAALTVTAHVSAAASMVIEVDEFSGVATTNALDRSVGASATGTAASSSSLTPASPGELLVG